MATQAVKFYSVDSLSESPNGNGLYFVTGGELYKGSQRFGLGRVTIAQSTEGVTGAARGDIVVTGTGAGWVYDGTTWQSIGGDVGTITSSWQADISAALAGLAVGGEGSYITGITQDSTTGKVTASAAAFPTFATGDADGQVKLGSTNATVSGWGAVKDDITFLKGVVTSTTVEETTTTKVTANAGEFGTLKVGENTLSFSEATASSSSAGITVSVTTENGSVKSVEVDASSFANTMHFLGVGTVTKDQATGVITVTAPEGKTPVAGDIVIDGTSGLEAICTGTEPLKWELIGDNALYALNAYTSGATVFAGVENVPGALNAAGAAIDTLNTKVTTLESAVTGGSNANGDAGVNVSVATAATTAAPTVTVTITKETLNSTLGTSAVADKTVSTEIGEGADNALATTSAVKKAVDAAELVWLGEGNAPIEV